MSDRVMLKGVLRRWHVYDRVRGSFPQSVPGLGLVQPDNGFKTEEEATEAAMRYDEFIVANPKAFA